MVRYANTFLVLILLAGCALPSFRVGQKKVDAKLAEKPAEQTEAERQGAKYIEAKSAVLEPDPAKQVAAIHQVAVPLSASLGEPAKPITIEDKDKVIAALQKGIVAEQKKADAWKAFAKKYHGTELEGTGFDLAGLGGGLGLLGLLAAIIFVPGFGTLVLFVIRRLRGTVQQVAEGIEAYRVDHPEQAAKLEGYLREKMDRAHKEIIKREKKFVNWAALTAQQKKAAAAQP